MLYVVNNSNNHKTHNNTAYNHSVTDHEVHNHSTTDHTNYEYNHTRIRCVSMTFEICSDTNSKQSNEVFI